MGIRVDTPDKPHEVDEKGRQPTQAPPDERPSIEESYGPRSGSQPEKPTDDASARDSARPRR